METYYVITFDTTHSSISADKRLEERGIPHKLIPIPQKISAGCGFCMKLPADGFDNALSVLTEGGVETACVYRAEKEGLRTEYIRDC